MIITECSKLPQKGYKKIGMTGVEWWSTNKWYMQKPESILGNSTNNIFEISSRYKRISQSQRENQT